MIFRIAHHVSIVRSDSINSLTRRYNYITCKKDECSYWVSPIRYPVRFVSTQNLFHFQNKVQL